MFRKLILLSAVAIVLFSGFSSTALASGRAPERLFSIAGPLEYVSDLSSPHYEVNGYVLLGLSAEITAMIGSDVVVIGTEVTGPSIYMRRTLQVDSIVPNASSASVPPTVEQSEAIPAPDLPVPTASDSERKVAPPASSIPPRAPSDDIVTIPVVADPSQESSEDNLSVTIPVVTVPDPNASVQNPKVSIPVAAEPIPISSGPSVKLPTPAPLFGSQSCVLFGRVEAIEAEYYVVDPVNAHFRYWVRSTTVDLAELVWQLVGVVADSHTLPDGAVRYDVTATVVLSRDLSDLVRSGDGLLFQMPVNEIAIHLHGQIMHWTPAPIIGNGRVLVGLRAVSEAMGATVEWNSDTKTATISLGDRQVAVALGSNQVIIHRKGQSDTIVVSDTASIVSDGRMMVPLRVLSEGLGLSVGWDDATRTIDLN